MSDSICVLHVDDDPNLTDMAATFLEREDGRITVRTATNAEVGREMLAEYDVDCIVSDYDMPGQNGIEFLEVVRAEYPDLPFILYTGKGSEEVASEAISAGVTDYLEKESGTDQYTVLANRITNVVESYRSQQRLAERNNELRRYKHMVNSMQEAACIYDEDGRFRTVNEYLADWYDTSREALEGEESGLIAAIREQIEDGDPYQALLDGQRDQLSGEIDARFPDHGYAQVEFRMTPLTVDGSVEGAVGVVRDITERKERERELRRAERRFEAMFNDPNILVGLIDTDGGIIDINETAVGYIDAELEAVTDRLFWETPWFTGDERLQREVREWVDQAAAGEYVEFEIDLSEAVGDHLVISGVFRPVRNDTGEVVSLLISGRDITEREKRENRLEHTTARLQALFEHSPDMINVHDAKGNIIDPNSRLCEETGYDREELTGTKVWNLDQAIDPDEARSLWREMETGNQRKFEGVYQRRDGSTFPVEVNLRRLSLDGETRFVVISRNISERKTRERDLERYEAIVENTEDGISIFTADGTIEFVNQRIADISGVPQADWVGEHVSMYTEIGTLTGEEVATIEEGIEAIVRGETDEVSIELTPDVPGDLGVIELRLTPFETATGTDHVIGFSRDVTERKRREQTLRELQHRTEELIRASTRKEIADIAVTTAHDVLGLSLSGVHLADDERTVLEPTAVTDEVREHLGEAPAYERTDPERSADAVNWEIFEAGETVVIEDTHDADGIPGVKTPSRSGIIQPLGDHGLFITSSPNPHAFDEGDVALIEIFATIVTAVLDRNDREATLRDRTRRLEAQKDRLDQFASIVSHDLRNPLNVAEGRLELAREEYDSEHLEPVARALDRMDALIDDLLTLSREGETVTDLEPVDLTTIAERCWTNVETTEATLATQVNRAVYADESRLKQVFENLIRNAVEHGDDDVTVIVGELDDGFYIEDDGAGIPESEREEVFDMGYSTNEEGTGFGLSIVEQIVEAHDWEINVTEGSDGGARFEITGVEFAGE
ncbi:PAS domain S-box protein [Halolamina sp. R1-12]|nr:PAS domain S-box protein [Halolamina sp. R1-12]